MITMLVGSAAKSFQSQRSKGQSKTECTFIYILYFARMQHNTQ